MLAHPSTPVALADLQGHPLQLPDEALSPLLPAFGSARVLGLGEPTHGTREAFQLKHRLIRFLAERGELRVLAFECGYSAAESINAYVLEGRGDPRQALKAQGYWCWQTEEILALLLWLRRHNAQAAPGRRVAFQGIDVQVTGNANARLRAFLTAAFPAGQALSLLVRLQEGQIGAGTLEAAEAVRAIRALEPVLPTLSLQADARNIWRYLDAYLNPENAEGLGRRDRYMAETLLETLPSVGLTAVWAHNEHVAANPDFFGSPALGWHLRQHLGEAYLALGMLFEQGEFQAKAWKVPGRPITAFSVGETPEEYAERQFSGQSPGIFDLRGAACEVRAAAPRRFLGMLFDEEAAQKASHEFLVARPLADFDLLAWFARTSRAIPFS